MILGKNTNPKKDEKEVTKKATNSKESSSKTKLNIGPVNINNASFTFEDKNLPLPFKTTVSKLNGKISEVKSNKSGFKIEKTNLSLRYVFTANPACEYHAFEVICVCLS